MTVNLIHEYLMHAAYFAPRGKKRLLELGSHISQRYLSSEDRLIGLVGDAGSGKSLLIRGMFPGLELTNDDNGINVRPLPLVRDAEEGHFRAHTYHVDARFESAFTQPWVLAEGVKQAIMRDRRVVVEHFEILYPLLQVNAQVLMGVGEEVVVTRPGAFGPYPDEMAKVVFPSLIYRKMAHSAEDLTAMVLEGMGVARPETHGDIRHGFILEFDQMPDIDLEQVEKKVLEYIARDEPIACQDEDHILIGHFPFPCTGPRLHVQRTGEIRGFSLLKDYRWDPISKLYTIAGRVGTEQSKLPGWGPFSLGPQGKEK